MLPKKFSTSLFLLTFFLVLSGGIFVYVNNPSLSIVQISGILGNEHISGYGVCISSDTLLTSAHVVRDDRARYEASRLGGVTIVSRDEKSDLATLRIVSTRCMPRMLRGTDSFRIGEKVSAWVSRGGVMQKIPGTITALSPQVLGYDSVGNMLHFKPRIETSIEFLPGESGLPIFDSWGRVVDVAHATKK